MNEQEIQDFVNKHFDDIIESEREGLVLCFDSCLKDVIKEKEDNIVNIPENEVHFTDEEINCFIDSRM